jgi:hypothetical protein
MRTWTVFAVISLCGCAAKSTTSITTQIAAEHRTERKEVDSLIDFRPFVERGFSVSPWRPDGDYELLAHVWVEFYPGVGVVIYETKKEQVSTKVRSSININQAPVPTPIKPSVWVRSTVEEAWELQEAMEALYVRCLDLGADGVIEFSIDFDSVTLGEVFEEVPDSKKGGLVLDNPGEFAGETVILEGYAVKRR